MLLASLRHSAPSVAWDIRVQGKGHLALVADGVVIAPVSSSPRDESGFVRAAARQALQKITSEGSQ